MHLGIFLLKLFRHRENDLLDLFLVGGQLHCRAKDPFLEVAEWLHSTMNVVLCELESRLVGGATGESTGRQCLEIWQVP